MTITTIFRDFLDSIRVLIDKLLFPGKTGDQSSQKGGKEGVTSIPENQINIEQGIFLYAVFLWENIFKHPPIKARINVVVTIVNNTLANKHGYTFSHRRVTDEALERYEAHERYYEAHEKYMEKIYESRYIYYETLLKLHDKKIREKLIEKNERGELSLTNTGRQVTKDIKEGNYKSLDYFDAPFQRKFGRYLKTIDRHVVPLLRLNNEDILHRVAHMLVNPK